MLRMTYLNLALARKNYRRAAWIYSAFSIIREDAEAYAKDPYLYRIVQKPNGFFFINDTGALEKIDDAKPNKPLFRFLEAYTVTPDAVPNATGTIETTVGNALVNLFLLVESTGTKIPFMTGRINVNTIGAIIGKNLRDTPKDGETRDPTAFYVDELHRLYDARSYITGLSQLCTWSATPKNVLPPEGNKAFKAKLLSEYLDKVGDPIELARMQAEWRVFDAEWLKGDPTQGRFISGKIAKLARLKMFFGLGADLSFTQTEVLEPVLASLDEGVPLTGRDFVNILNAQRYGSYSRGANTVFGGVSLKLMQSVLSAIRIVPGDCGTKTGEGIRVDTHLVKVLAGEYFWLDKKWVQLDESGVKDKLGEWVITRSPTHCLAPPNSYCAACVGEGMAAHPMGIANAGAEVSTKFLYSFMKLMHGKELAVAEVNTAQSLS